MEGEGAVLGPCPAQGVPGGEHDQPGASFQIHVCPDSPPFAPIIFLLLGLELYTRPKCQVTLSGGTGAIPLQMFFPVMRGRKRCVERSMQLEDIDT